MTLEWPLYQGDRSHIEGLIDAWNLPVRHSVRVKGRPHTRVLEKTPALSEREAAERRAREKNLKRLRQIASRL